MAQNLELDPVAKDYVVVNGSPIETDRVEEATYFALAIPQGKGLYQTINQGSLLYTLENAKRTSSIEQQFSTYAQVAVQLNVIDAGKASASQVENISTSRTGTSNQVSVIPSLTQLSQQLNFVPV